MADTTFKTGFTSTFSLLLLILSFSFRNYSCWSYWSYIVGVLVKKYVLDTKNKKIRSGFLLLLLILLPEIYSGFELGEKSRLTKTKNPSESKREKNLAAGNFFFFFFFEFCEWMNTFIFLYIQWLIKCFSDVKYVFKHIFSLMQTLNRTFARGGVGWARNS